MKYDKVTIIGVAICVLSFFGIMWMHIEKAEEAIEIWNAIANQYKAIMNAYLGIVEEEAVVEEPAAEEGDEE